MEKNKYTDFGNRIKALREKKGITQLQLATDMGMSKQSMNSYEKGKHSPDIELLAKLANYFECSTDYLVGLSEHPSKKDSQCYFEDMSRLSQTLLKLPLRLREVWLGRFVATAECIQQSMDKDIKISFDLLSMNIFFEKIMDLWIDTADKQRNKSYTERDWRKANHKLHEYLNKMRAEINYLDDVSYQYINAPFEKNDNNVTENLEELQHRLNKLIEGENE